jgi:hypothetical protein
LRLPSFRRDARAYGALLVVLFAYLMFARTRASADSFLMLRDQIRDWGYALGSLRSLPLTGTQSTAGGSSLGPIYYWILWLARVVVGPWTSGLPHAGAVGISIVQTLADLLLLEALRRRTGSLWIAVATVLFTATASHDLAVSSTIWNPAVSIAFVKLAIALLLLGSDQPSARTVVSTTAAAWFAVQAHSAAVFVALPIVASFVLRDLGRRSPGVAFQHARTIVEVIVVLQLPYLYQALTATASVGPGRLVASAAGTLAHPETLRVTASLTALVESISSVLFTPYAGPWGPIVLALAIAAIVVCLWRDLTWLTVTVIPLACAVAGFALWQQPYDEYWYLPLAPCAAIAIARAATLFRARETTVVLIVVVVALQPGRVAHSLTWYRMPEYRALASGARDIRRQTAEVRRIRTSFPLPGLSSATFLYEVLGGRLNPAAQFDATIDADGHATFVPVK